MRAHAIKIAIALILAAAMIGFGIFLCQTEYIWTLLIILAIAAAGSVIAVSRNGGTDQRA